MPSRLLVLSAVRFWARRSDRPFLAVHQCFCASSLLLGGAAIWLGLWVRKNFSGNTASEVANIYAWAGIITGGIGVFLGVMIIIMWIAGGGLALLGGMGAAGATLDEMSRSPR